HDAVYVAEEVYGRYVYLTKKSGKELNERNFSAEERRLFDQAKRAEIQVLLDSEAIELVMEPKEVETAVYGLVNAPAAWRKRVRSLLVDLGYKECSFDPCLYVLVYTKTECDELAEPLGAAGYVLLDVDDFAQGGNSRHQELMERLRTQLRFGKWREVFQGSGDYIGRTIFQDANFEIRELEELCSGLAVKAGLMLEPRANKVVAELKATPEVCVRILPIPLADGMWMAACDAALANAEENKSQGGFLVMFAEKKIMNEEIAKISVNSWKSHRLKRVVKASMGAEALAMDDALAELEWVRAMYTEAVKYDYCLHDLDRYGSQESVITIRLPEGDDQSII
ncbi:GIP, partial [Symbiodinium necroappetens]